MSQVQGQNMQALFQNIVREAEICINQYQDLTGQTVDLDALSDFDDIDVLALQP